jgi:hypothetical protein|tara:strand:+ start:2175 stop:2552 length:378 start_codon:yes stop_codon:yes gene_type:complete
MSEKSDGLEDLRFDSDYFESDDYHREEWVVNQVKQINSTPDELSEILFNADISAFDIYTQALSNLLQQEHPNLDDSVEQLRLSIENIIIKQVDTDEQYHKYCDEQLDVTLDDEISWSNKFLSLWK